MVQVISVLFPVFVLILAGYVCRKTGRLGETAAAELNKFVVWLCLPALLFKLTATTPAREIWHPDFFLAVSLASLIIFVGTVFWRWRGPRHLADASIDGLSAAYANTGYMGIPLCLLVLGEEGMAPALIATLIVVCVLFAIAVICIEIGLQSEQKLHQAAGVALLALLKNPLVSAPLFGACWNMADLGVAAPILQLLNILGDATIPAALVSLGLFLAQDQQGDSNGSLGLVSIKLLLHPLLTWIMVFHVFHLPLMWAKAALLLCALPTGTGPYMLAEFYQREASVVSRSILLSTVGSLVTLSLCIYWIS